ncbi:MAG: neutral/alkaline non-lysosomal ceramidase N-terminal domain-containing protein [Verrucomicrobiota bacterium]|jgi:neutral ceramidase
MLVTVYLSGLISWQLVTSAGWKIGFARKEITPQASVWMSGYASRDRGAEGTRTPLWAKAMALEDASGSQALLITLDLVGVSADVTGPVRRQLAEDLGLTLGDILINCSHTHTGPVVGENLRTMYILEETDSKLIRTYTVQLKSQLVELGKKAFQNRQTARLRAGQSHATFATNRRQNPESHVPAWRAAGKLLGPVDYSVPILEVRNQDNELQGLIFGYACHATVLSDYQWSGDYPGYAQAYLENAYEGVQAMFWAGCGADINPLPRRKVELAEAYGKALGEAVIRGIEGALPEVEASLETDYNEIPLRFDSLPSKESLEEEASSENRYAASRANKWLKHLESGESIPQTYDYPVGLWRLGDQIEWITLGGEVVVDFALRFKKEYGPHVWVAGYSHDIMGYIPSKRVWTEGGYEGGGSMVYYGQPTRWSSDVEFQITQAVQRMMKTTKE